MDCAICFDSITKQTGCTTLSCDHSFHFRCITNWFGQQVCNALDQTCPCCRGKGSDLDRCSVVEEDEYEDDEEDEDYEEDEESQDADSEMGDLPVDISDFRWERVGPGRWFIVSAHEVAFEGLRSLFGAINEAEFVEDPVVEAARKIQAIYRGFKARETFRVARSLHHLRG